MSGSLTLITRKFAPIAEAYAKFLNIQGIATVSIITGSTYYGYEVSIYADEDDYLKPSFEDEKFNQLENHINELLNAIESLYIALFNQDDDDELDDDFFEYYDEYEEEYDDEIEPRGDNYFN